jgi:hypothetical protein
VLGFVLPALLCQAAGGYLDEDQSGSVARMPYQRRRMFMPEPKPVIESAPQIATHEDLRRAFGDLDDAVAMEILGLNPSLAALGEAATYLRGDGDFLARQFHQLSAPAAEIVTILATIEEEEEERRPS